MESVNATFEKAIEFLSIIQAICERRRFQVEELSLKYYATYQKERKEELKNKELEAQKICQEEEKTNSLEIDCLEELALTDSVLQKAQVIRSQNKISSELLAVHATTSSECLLYNDKHMTKIINDDSLKNYAALPRCNSAPNAITSKISRGLQSKSIINCISKKETCLPSTLSNSRKNTIAQVSTQQKSRAALNSNDGCISSKTYNDLKCLTVNSSVNKYKRKKEKCIKVKNSTSDSPHNLQNHSSLLTYQSFKKEFTKRCCLESNFQFPSSGFWYTFISFKNRESLIHWSKSDSAETFISVVNLMFEIQEIMMWIDLLSFMGNEVLPFLRLVKQTDPNIVRLCSFLSSIYHESLQRIPMLDFN